MAKKEEAAQKYTVTAMIKGEERECEVVGGDVADFVHRHDGKLLVRTVGDHIIQRRFLVDIETGLSDTGVVCEVTKVEKD